MFHQIGVCACSFLDRKRAYINTFGQGFGVRVLTLSIRAYVEPCLRQPSLLIPRPLGAVLS
jgi:hypothetical protein